MMEAMDHFYQDGDHSDDDEGDYQFYNDYYDDEEEAV